MLTAKEKRWLNEAPDEVERNRRGLRIFEKYQKQAPREQYDSITTAVSEEIWGRSRQLLQNSDQS